MGNSDQPQNEVTMFGVDYDLCPHCGVHGLDCDCAYHLVRRVETGEPDRDDWDEGREWDGDYYDDDDLLADCYWTGTWGDVCGAAGSEDCDWDCPYSSEMIQGLRTPRDGKGRFAKKHS